MRKSIEDKLLHCIHCGLCLDACPTFRLTGSETDSPRGRIYLMRSVSEATIPLDADVAQHLDACLGCRACETACPSGVEYAGILEHFREEIEKGGIRPSRHAFARRQLLATLTNPQRFAATLKAASLGARLAGSRQTMPGWMAELLTGAEDAHVTLPAVPDRVEVGRLPERSAAIGEKRYTVGVLAGCVMRVLYHGINEATVRVLQLNGCEVLAPRSAGCCGALHVHTGFVADAQVKARALLDAVDGLALDAFVINSAGCGSTLKEYGKLLADDPIYAQRARAFAAKVKDVSEFLDEIGLRPPEGEFAATVAYHDACHLAHGQGITAQPRRILSAVPGLCLVSLPEADMCCGSAGTYNLTQPEMARALLERKLDNVASTGASIVAMGNPGCLAWIAQGLKERGMGVRAMHPVEILDEAYRRASA